MAHQDFYLVGNGTEVLYKLDISTISDLDTLKDVVGAAFNIVVPSGISFEVLGNQLDNVDEIKNVTAAIGITVDGHAVRSAPGPQGLPFIGNYFEIFPDHIGNNQRLFDRYGPIFRTTSFGKTVFQVNDPELALIAFTESQFFSKKLNENHPLYSLRDDKAGVFLSDTDTEAWRIVHKFMPPALGPKAVRHYAPIMNRCINGALPVFDHLEKEDDAWNVYQYMVKLASETVAKVLLGMDFEHFQEPDCPLHPMVVVIAEALSLNKKIASKGALYANLPFGDPKKLHDLIEWQKRQIENIVEHHESSGDEDLPLQEAALEAANMIDYFCRAVDSNGKKLPKEYLVSAIIVASGAGFSTTAILLSWLIFGLVTYPGMQTRLLQELVDAGFREDTDVTPEFIDKLEFQAKYVKEMQRVHNPAYQPGRTALVDLILPGGYQLHKGDCVIASIHHIHNNENFWDNPKHFDPDRWDTDKVKSLPKAAYCPFAVGQRSCIGFNFALQEVKLFLPKLVWRYEWFKHGETAVEYDPFFQLVRPVNLYVRTKKRTMWPSKSDYAEW